MNSIINNIAKLALALAAVFALLFFVSPNQIYASTANTSETVILSADEPAVANVSGNVLSSANEPVVVRNRVDGDNQTSSASEPINVLSSASEPNVAAKERGTSPYVHVITK
ncbi:MAG: hypothetical protein KIH69_017020 [Anaerolineae bacterium]|nr:hypothetical protein [Anaerolineae bacterium]